MNNTVFDIEKLREVALDQYGYVTTAQATDVNVSKPNLSMLAKRGRIEHICYGVYRIPQVPPSIYDRYMLALLWTGADEAVLSHETALAAYDVCDINPTAIDVTIEHTRRIRRSGGEGYRLHFQDFDQLQVGWWEGMRCVKLATAIDQCIESGVASYLLEQALDNGRRKGLITAESAKELSLKLQSRDEND